MKKFFKRASVSKVAKKKNEASCGVELNALLHSYFTLMFKSVVADFEALLSVLIVFIQKCYIVQQWCFFLPVKIFKCFVVELRFKVQ